MPFSSSKVVVPVDFSGESPAALKAALDVVENATQIHLVHVLLPLDAISPGVLLGDVSDETRTQHIKANLEKLALEAGAVGAHQVVLIGSPGLEIAEYAKEEAADLIIIPSHGYHGVKRMVLGSVAERVIRHAECSVLVLRRTDSE